MRKLQITHEKMIRHVLGCNPYLRMWVGALDMTHDLLRYSQCTDAGLNQNREAFWRTLEICRQMVIHYHEQYRYFTVYFNRLHLAPDGPQSLDDWIAFHNAVASLEGWERLLMLLKNYSGIERSNFGLLLGLTAEELAGLETSAESKLKSSYAKQSPEIKPRTYQARIPLCKRFQAVGRIIRCILDCGVRHFIWFW
jgi:hypothetical protein